jgi:hypothetical protein
MVKGPSSTKLLIGCSLLSKATTGQAVARRCQPEDDDHGTWTTEVRPATRRPSRRWYGKAYLSAWRRRSMPSTRVLLLNPHHEGRIGHRQLCRGLDEQPRQPRLRGQRPRLQPCQTFCAHSRCPTRLRVGRSRLPREGWSRSVTGSSDMGGTPSSSWPRGGGGRRHSSPRSFAGSTACEDRPLRWPDGSEPWDGRSRVESHAPKVGKRHQTNPQSSIVRFDGPQEPLSSEKLPPIKGAQCEISHSKALDFKRAYESWRNPGSLLQRIGRVVGRATGKRHHGMDSSESRYARASRERLSFTL